MKRERYLPNRTQAPPGGWKFEVKETGAVFEGNSLGEVVEMVRKHRAVNGLEQALDGEKEIEDAVCERVPQYCTSEVPELEGNEGKKGLS